MNRCRPRSLSPSARAEQISGSSSMMTTVCAASFGIGRLAQLRVKRRGADLQDARGFAHVSTDRLHGGADIGRGDLLERPHLPLALRKNTTGSDHTMRILEKQILGSNLAAVRHEHRAFEHIAQLTDVARPGILIEL